MQLPRGNAFMRFRLIVAAALASAATPLWAKPVEYRMISDDADIGHYIVDRQGQAISVDYDIKQNGRGPTIRETVVLTGDGTPAAWKITGRTTFGNAVDERFCRGKLDGSGGQGRDQGQGCAALLHRAKWLGDRHFVARQGHAQGARHGDARRAGRHGHDGGQGHASV
jgi:hypothetical protein